MRRYRRAVSIRAADARAACRDQGQREWHRDEEVTDGRDVVDARQLGRVSPQNDYQRTRDASTCRSASAASRWAM
jgi:hypothetical protein